jgi:hydrogenase maturation factor
MCITIPKKVISKEGDFFVVENPVGDRQKVKSIVELKIGDFVHTQQNIVVEKLNKENAKEILNIFNGGKK